jgi:sulfonate transport system permease protein
VSSPALELEQAARQRLRIPSVPRSSRAWQRLLSPLALLLIWQAASSSGLLATRFVAAPTTIARTAIDLTRAGTLPDAIAVSLQRVAIGFTIGALTGVALALVAGLSRIGENVVDPPLQMLRTLPFYGLIPLFILWFGIGETPKVMLVALGALFPIYLNTFAGIRGVDHRLLEVGRTLELSRFATIRHIVLPGALPQALVGLRQSLGVAWLALIVAEQVNADAGLGYMINDARDFMRTDIIVVGLLVYCLLGLVTDAFVRLLERRALAWRQS